VDVWAWADGENNLTWIPQTDTISFDEKIDNFKGQVSPMRLLMVSAWVYHAEEVCEMSNSILEREEKASWRSSEFNKRLDKLQDAVTKFELGGLRSRWVMGKVIAAQRRGSKLLPTGLLDEIATRVGISRSELRHRVMFADRYPTKAELANAIGQFPSWFQMVRDGLSKTKCDSENSNQEEEFDFFAEVDFLYEWLSERMKSWPEPYRSRFVDVAKRALIRVEGDLDD
jgi:hypothetical protein